MGTPQLLVLEGHPDFLDLPWDQPLDDWTHPRLVDMPRGVHRHPVVFVEYESGVYAIKELGVGPARNEFDVLTHLAKTIQRSARPAALVTRPWVPEDEEMAGVVVTRYVEHSFPYRRLVSGSDFGDRRDKLLDSVAGLLVELHLAGCFWGDCSLSNLLYRYDAGAIEAVMIDAETSSVVSPLSEGRRRQDLEIMVENLAGDMSDLAAASGREDEADLELGFDVESRYHSLWAELTEALVISNTEAYRIREKINRLNDLGFSVKDVSLNPTDAGSEVEMTVTVGNRTFNTDRLRSLTGLAVSENQARLLISDLNYHLAKRPGEPGIHDVVGIYEWLSKSLEPMLEAIRRDWSGDDPIQGYCDFLNHRIRIAAEAGHDVANEEAYRSWVESGFPGFD